MPKEEHFSRKKLSAAGLYFDFLTTSGTPSIELQCAVDGGSFTSIKTDSTTTDVYLEATVDANSNQFTEGREYEFLIISKGVEVMGLTYKYDPLKSLI